MKTIVEVPTMSAATLEATIRDFLRTEVAPREEIGPETSLLASGLVDSAGMIRLAAVLERETGRLIPDQDVTADNFDSIAKILAYLARR